MNYSVIKENDIADGTGVRVTLFVSGCRHHCKECFQPETWNFSYGKPFTDETLNKILTALAPKQIEGLTLLGGEPMDKANQSTVKKIVTAVRDTFGDTKNIWCYSGYTFETDILEKNGDAHTKDTMAILSQIDILVDGEFVLEKKNLRLNFRGSENQRIIDVKRSLAEKKTILSDLNN